MGYLKRDHIKRLTTLTSDYNKILSPGKLILRRGTPSSETSPSHVKDGKWEILVQDARPGKKLENKGSLRHAFSACVYCLLLRFLRNYLGWLTPQNNFENANSCSKPTFKTRVETRHKMSLSKIESMMFMPLFELLYKT